MNGWGPTKGGNGREIIYRLLGGNSDMAHNINANNLYFCCTDIRLYAEDECKTGAEQKEKG